MGEINSPNTGLSFAAKLRLLRAMRGVSQQELADKVQMPIYAMSNLESGKLLPGPNLEARIKAALGWPENADEAFAILERVPVAVEEPSA